MYLVNSDLLG